MSTDAMARRETPPVPWRAGVVACAKLAAGLVCLLPAQVHAGPFTFTHESVKQGTETEIIITGPKMETFQVTWTDANGKSQTSSVTSGSAMDKPHVNISAGKGTSVKVTNTSELEIPAQDFVATLFRPSTDVITTALGVLPGSSLSVGGNTFSVSGGFTTVATAVDYAPSSATFGSLGGYVPASSFALHGTGSAGSINLTLGSNTAWGINLAAIWGQALPDEGLSVAFNIPFSGLVTFNSVSSTFTGNFTGSVTFFTGNAETICGSLQSGSLSGDLCASGTSINTPVPEPGALALMLAGWATLMGVRAFRGRFFASGGRAC